MLHCYTERRKTYKDAGKVGATVKNIESQQRATKISSIIGKATTNTCCAVPKSQSVHCAVGYRENNILCLEISLLFCKQFPHCS
jgi:hypothetical protein